MKLAGELNIGRILKEMNS